MFFRSGVLCTLKGANKSIVSFNKKQRQREREAERGSFSGSAGASFFCLLSNTPSKVVVV